MSPRGKALAIFLATAVVSAGLMTALWHSGSLLAFVLPVAVYLLVSLRWVPWKTTPRRMASMGFATGLIVVVFAWAFRLI